MNLSSLSQIRQRLWAYGPIKKTVYSLATQAQFDEFNECLNQVCEVLLGKMKPRFTMRRINVPVYDNSITIPRELDSIDGIEMVDDNNCACSPLQIYSRFHEWAHPVSGCSCNTTVFVLSDLVQTFLDPSPGDSGFYLRVKSTEGDTPTVSFKGGYDTNWDQIFSTTDLVIGNGTFTTTQAWVSMPQVIKPVTDNLVELYSVDVATSEETLIAVYAPGEEIPAYRRYKVPNWNDQYPLARVFGKLGFIRVVADDDIVFPQHTSALKAGLQALNYENAADYDRSEVLWAKAQKVLDDEMAEANDAELPVFHVDSQFGAGNIPNCI